MSASLKVLSTLAVQGALPELTARHQELSGTDVEIIFAPTKAVVERIADGETADVAIITRAALEKLAAKGVIAGDTITDIAVSRVGIAVPAGAVKPDISSIDALKATLLAATSIAYSRIGASGVFFADLLRRLGIEDEVNAKASIIPGGLTAELAARGEVELAVQQISELMAVPGIEVVGPMPPGAESVTMFSAGLFAGTTQAEAARALVASLRAPNATQALAAAGLRPA